jgi:hypothetical protein
MLTRRRRVGGWTTKKITAHHLRSEYVSLAIRLECSGEQVAVEEIPHVVAKEVAGANCHHAA